METGDETVEPGGNWCHFGRLKKKLYKRLIDWRRTWIKDAERVQSQCHISDFFGDRQLWVREARPVAQLSPRWGPSGHVTQENVTDGVSVRLEPFYTQTTNLTTPFPPLIPIGHLHFRFFLKETTLKKTTKKKKKWNVFNSRYQNRFCKTWTAWHSFNFHYSPFNLTNQEDKFGFSLKIYFPTERCRTSSFIQSVQSLIHDSRVKSYCENMK